MYSRLFKPPGKSFFLFGPRGTGKSSWVRRAFPKGLYLDLLHAELYNDLLAAPHRLENLVPKKFHDWVVIDEIQKIPALLDEVHRLIEKHQWKFVMTGSSARKLKTGNVNLLAGRALTRMFHPLTSLELGADFQLSHSLKFGLLPSVYVESDPKSYLESYVGTYLQQEIQQEGLTRNLGAFSRFLEAASFSQGSVLNISEVARECAVQRKVVEGYFEILNDTLVAFQLPVFTRRAKRRMTGHPKFYFCDVGIFRTVRPQGPLDRPEEIDGAAFETLCLQQFRALNDYGQLGYQLYYWRSSQQQEVDLVLYGTRGIRAFEMKRTRRLRGEDFRGLKAFLADYPMAKAHLIYMGERRMREGDIDIVPAEEFFRDTAPFLE